jgi:hypothetical protein
MPGGALAVQQTENIPEYRGKIDLAEAFKLKFKHNYTFQQLANRYGVVPSAVHGALKNFLNLMHSPEQSRIYEEKRAEILNSVEFRIVTQMVNKKKLKAASLNNLAYAASQINNMIRLEKGQPTAITEHLDSDLGSMIDQLCGLKSAGSGSTIDVSGKSDTPATSLPSSPDDDILSSLLPAVPTDPGTFTPDQSTAPAADRSTCGNLEPTNSPVQPTKRGKRGKYAPRTTTKSASSSRKQSTGKITSTLDSKVDTVKQGTNPIQPAETTSAAGKEWYE